MTDTERQNMQQHVPDRINELVAELSESREDSRSTQAQIFEIINIVGTVLGSISHLK